jgi:ketosteroid isomerase-like protein
MLIRGKNRGWLALAGAAMLLAVGQPAFARAAPVPEASLLDRIQIEDMMVEYYSMLSGGVVHDVGDYFTEDAVLVANGTSFESRETIRHLYQTAVDVRILENNIYNMILANPRITVNGDIATMDAIWTGYLSDNIWSTPRLVEQGAERTTFIKQDGVWLITSRRITHHGGMPDFAASEN